MAMYNSTFCFIDETKLTEEEWNKVHAEEVADHDFFPYGYFHCFSYVAYSASFDRCMAHQIKTRDELRDWYKRLTKRTYTPDFHEVWSDFSDIFKGVYGYRPKFLETVLNHMGVSMETYRADMDKAVQEYWASVKKEG